MYICWPAVIFTIDLINIQHNGKKHCTEQGIACPNLFTALSWFVCIYCNIFVILNLMIKSRETVCLLINSTFLKLSIYWWHLMFKIIRITLEEGTVPTELKKVSNLEEFRWKYRMLWAIRWNPAYREEKMEKKWDWWCIMVPDIPQEILPGSCGFTPSTTTTSSTTTLDCRFDTHVRIALNNTNLTLK